MKLEQSNLIVKRAHKEVYKTEEGIVKIFGKEHPKADVFNEALNTARVEATGLDIPKVKPVSYTHLGSPNYCTESSTCFQASNMAWKSIYGNDICFPDLANANTVMLWASNLYHSNTPMSKIYRGMKARGVKIIVVDPRNTVTAREADIHLRLLPGTDGALALGMAQVMIEEDLYDHEFVEKYVHGFEEYRAYVKQFTPEYTCLLYTSITSN